jgi:hypothetical protein
MDYLSFDLRLADWTPATGTGVAEVLHSPVGEGDRYPFRLDPDIVTATGNTRRTPSEALHVGKVLSRAVLAPAFTQWYESYQVARERGRGLRLRLHIDSWELTRLPWELLYDGRRREFLVFDPLVSLVRYLRLHAPPPTIRQGRSLRVLAVSAAPHDQVPLDWEREQRMLEDALTELTAAGQVEVIPCAHATYERLHTALMENAPDVVHYIGHGHYDHERALGMLLLEDAAGRSAPLAAPEAARVLRRYGVNLVVLNACDSAQGTWAGLAPSLVRAEIPAVVAMQWPVEDQAAIRFSHAFYRALFRGRTIDECMCEARVGASGSSADPNDWAAPVLFLRSVSGRLWVNDITGGPDRRAPGSVRRPSRRTAAGSGRADGPRFKTRGPLQSAVDGELLVDRPALRRALRLAQQPSVTQYIAILSPRQTGKTTLLLRLMELLQPVATCVFIDLSVLRAQDARACYRFVAFQLVSEFRAAVGSAVRLPEVPPIESSVDFLEFLRELAEAVPMPRIILLLDEVGALTPEASDSFFNTVRTVFTQGRGLNSHLAKYLFIYSGAVDLYALTFGTNSPLNVCEKIYLNDFDVEDVTTIVEQFTHLGVTVPAEAPRAIHALTGGHPYLTMRLCALLEEAGHKALTRQAIEAAAEQMLVEDDNIHHVIHELERRPIERRRLRAILLEERQVPFSRNDPVLASLEMIGAIRPTQPCQLRNRLYARALRRYFRAHAENTGTPPAVMPAEVEQLEDPDALYGRLLALRHAAMDARGAYRPGREWEAFAAALFATVPAFSVYPDLHADTGQLDVALTINRDAPGGTLWAMYQPLILVEQCHLEDGTPERTIARLATKAAEHRARLLFVLATGGGPEAAARCAALSGLRGDLCVTCLPDAVVAELLEERGSLDTFLRIRVREARLRQLN